jgi:hypothetical protein
MNFNFFLLKMYFSLNSLMKILSFYLFISFFTPYTEDPNGYPMSGESVALKSYALPQYAGRKLREFLSP